MGVRPVKQATCMCCKEKFDRNKIPFIVSNTSPTNPRYIHASCAERNICANFVTKVFQWAKKLHCQEIDSHM